ncbi:Spx/MgsR family RNA polymerase-binding regulatory protein [Candidatus Phytoplasma australiense]|uniref:Regulatory protein spx n=1 Tax=Strawberry lethal yellows phytoplasma (CPA) str. NZSb11 TaxID=980422 RepID=R4RVT4_PHYAS|nr:Spx/MgsR family RNA polymerase-binding regulatory protein [Candidatus Phytoplasma australiense]AGL89942.1 Regulatory protein spx [Strawberry lethal yellows phytoplasma (CPA) str. NZSb11]
MVIFYTSFNCSSCQKAKKWLKQHRIEFIERSLFGHDFQQKDIDLILKNCLHGFDDIISKLSKFFKEQNIDFNNLSTKEVKQIIMQKRSILKRPILVEGQKIQIGFNSEGIRIFMPKNLRDFLMKNDVFYKAKDKYKILLKKFFENKNNDEPICK